MPVAKSKPLKLQSVDQGDLKRLSPTEENYLAYLVGTHLIESDSDTGNITLSSTGNNSIGSFTDTFFNEPDGTHPASAITSGTTTTELYQVGGSADETDSDFRKPVGYYNPPTDGPESVSSEGVYEMADSDLNILIDRINGRIAQSDYLGQFHLGTTAPSGDYNLFLNGVFTDTLNDSTANTYNIYRRESQSAPSQILDSDSNPTLIMSVKRSQGDSGDFEGLERMTERQVRVSLGQRAKTQRSLTGGIGSYQLRSSSQGAPSTGSWRIVGTATNTKKETDEISYTRNRVSTFTRQRPSAFTRNSVDNFVGNYAGDFTRDFSGNFVGNYSRDFIGNYVGDYTRDFAGAYTGNYSRTFIGEYSGNFVGDFVGNYTRGFTRTLTFSRDSTRTVTGSFTGDFVGQRTINFVGNFTGNYNRNFIGNYSRTPSFVGNYSRNITSTRTSTRTSSSTVSEGPFYSGSFVFRTGDNLTEVIWNGITVVSEDFGPLTSVPGTDGYTYFRGAFQAGPFPGGFSEYSVSRSRTESFTGNFAGNFTRVSSFTRTSTRTESFSRTRVSSFTRQTTGDFIGNFTGNFTRSRTVNFTGNFIGNYARSVTYTGNFTRDRETSFTRDFTRNRISTYTRVSTRNSVLNFTRNSTRTRTSAFTRERTGTRTSSFTRDFTRTRSSSFTGNYSRDITDTFSRTLIDSFVGTTIQPTSSVIETYSLYVRYA